MSVPRVTQRLMVQRSLSSLQLGMNRVSDLQEQLSTGRQINRPSDNPTGANDAMRLRAQIASDTQHARNVNDAQAWMGTTDSTLMSMMDQVQRARDLIVQGASTGNNGPDARAALATELGQLKQSLLGLANTQYLGRPIFGGTTGGSAAYDATGTFVGDAYPVNRRIGDGDTVAVNVVGSTAFSDGTNDLFSVISTAIDNLTGSNGGSPNQLGSSLTALDSVAESMKTAQADLGSRVNRVDDAATRLQSTTLDNKSALSDIENVDMADAIMNLQLQQVAYQGALGATAQVMQRSLLDFLH